MDARVKRFLMTFFCIAAISAGVFYAVSVPRERTDMKALGGVLDLRDANLDDDVFALDGEWEFYWDRLYAPADFAGGISDGKKTFIKTPMAWNGAGYPRVGQATYRLLLLLPEGEFTLYVPEILAASAVWVNGEKVFIAGSLGTGIKDSVPCSKNETLPLPRHGGVAEIVVNASNFHRMNGGVCYAFRVASERKLIRWAFSRWLMLSGLAGAFFLVGIYHVMLYLSRREARIDFIYLVFAGCCAVSGLRFLTCQDSIAQFFSRGWLNIYLNPIYWILFTLYTGFLVVFTAVIFDLKPGRALKTTLALLLAAPVVMMILPAPLNRFGMYLNAASTLFTAALAARTLSAERVQNKPYLGLLLAAVLCHVIWGTLTSNPGRAYFFAPFALSHTFVMLCQFVILSQDYAETRKKEQALATENATLERMANVRAEVVKTLSHEIRTPLSVMSVYAQMAVKQIQEGRVDERMTDDLRTIGGEAARLSQLAAGALTLSQLSGMGEKPSEMRRPINIGELVGHLASLFGTMAEKRDRPLTISLPESLPRVRGETEALTGLLWNLMDNALTHGKHGGIEIYGESGRDTVRISIRDEGTGIPPELLPRIFERGMSGVGRTGLGLFFCREIARRHGGDITVESEYGAGTQVSLILPLDRSGETDG